MNEPEFRCAPGTHEHRERARAASRAAIAGAARILRAAADPGRLTLLTLLADGEACVSELTAWVEEPVANVSQRLRLLQREGLLASRREGKHVFYSLADEHVVDLLMSVIAHAEEDHRTIATAAPGGA